MKTKLTPIVLLLLLVQQVRSQIPNGGFEDWSGTNIIGWVNTNGLMALSGNNQSVFQSGNANGGSYACEMVGTKVNNKPGGVFVPDYVGSIFVGKQILLNSYRGFPYTYQPQKFEYWYKFTPKGMDTASAIVILTKWNTTMNQRDTLAIAMDYISKPDSVAYVKSELTLNYLKTGEPDTAILMFSAVSINANHEGTRYIIDDLAFTGGNVGIKEQAKIQSVQIYPNPAKETITIEMENNHQPTILKVYDELGQLVYTENKSVESETPTKLSNLKNGVYLLQLESGNQRLNRKFIISN